MPLYQHIFPTPTTHDMAVYVHWPWCLKKCPYCDFNAHAWTEIPHMEYRQALFKQLKSLRELTGPRQLVAVFFGGGTPSLMGAALVGEILEEINRLWGVPAGTEVTLEANPTSSPASLFGQLVAAGVNRVSIGVQALQDEQLRFLGRQHDVKAALATLVAAQAAVGNVNADVIFGLPSQDIDLWSKQLRELASMGLAHLSCYQLTVEPQTHFYSAVKRGEWQPPDNDTQADFIEITENILGGAGYQRYEVSNFCRNGRACRHNYHVWQYGDYLGAGPGAHGRLRLAGGPLLALRTTKHPRHYLETLADARRDGSAVLRTTPLVLREAWQEALLAGLRLSAGVDVAALESSLGSKMHQNVNGEGLANLLHHGFLEQQGGMLRVPFVHQLKLDRILTELLG